MSHNFKDFGIPAEVTYLIGKSISLDHVLNLPIKVLDFRIGPSKKKPNTEYLTLQIETEGVKRVIFTGATVLIQQIKKVDKDKFPFNATIIKKNEYYEFT
ncbi:hypothetical protein Q764_06075 [Flavobacterium suncheonense GH29-5 = DSM 17707]|uniref:Uncharacterized protein n=1 Tax=Flavobacterium suncheonense GH29-5 = DSM 17707 TaxID=1121899 RepID=A0A0A2ME98_9FLAO|nr:hypothetical protein Q764_06075 [Flavobacterium suncheonense GH29-5 = DSM 17707]